jgi:mono/diheme cytochrome c family protein
MKSWKKVLRGLGMVLGGLLLLLGVAVLYGAATGEAKLQHPAWPAPELVASKDPEVIARGKYLAHGPAHCSMCHTTDDIDHPEKVATTPFSGGLEFAMGPIGTRYGRNLTSDVETGIGRLTDAELARSIRSGVMSDGELSIFMSMAVGELSDTDLVAVMSYLRSLPPVKKAVPRGEWGVLAKVLTAFGIFQLAPRSVEGPAHVPPGDEPSIERGGYLAKHAALCGACHTPTDPTTFKPNGPPFSGGTPEASHGADSDYEYAPPNLTAAPTGYVGRMAEDVFVARMRAGRTHLTSIMPWECYVTMTDADLRSIYRFLKSVPPVDVETGPAYRKIGSFPPK